MIYVLVRIRPTPGKGLEIAENEIGAYNRLMEKEGGKPIGNFVVRVGEGAGDHVHLFGYPDLGGYADAVDKMAADPRWQEFVARVSPQVASVDLTVLRPLSESSLQ